jgi:hypothetical protein
MKVMKQKIELQIRMISKFYQSILSFFSIVRVGLEDFHQGFHFLLISANQQNQQICCLLSQQKSANQQK